MLASAVEDGRIPRNPVTGAKLPPIDGPPFVPLTVEEIRRLAAAASDHVRAAFVVVAGTGLRQGELFGLTVDRIDFLRRELRVDQQLWTPRAGPAVLAPVKSRNSYRTVGLGQVVTEAIAAHLAMDGPGEFGLVFHVDGRTVHRGTGWKYVSKAGVASGVGKLVPVDGATDRSTYVGPSWHDLRHHHASVLLSHGVSPALVAERLGHDIKTLMRTYAHVIRSDEDRVRSIVDDSLGSTAEDWLRTG